MTWMELKGREQNEASLHDLFPICSYGIYQMLGPKTNNR